MEGNFEAFNLYFFDHAPGIRVCAQPPRTIFETKDDKIGGFHGVAIYQNGDRLLLVSELTAGHYRYASKWEFLPDGTILPSFGFTAVNDSQCACFVHYHHAYWRFDFDIDGPSNNCVREYNDPALVTDGQPIPQESVRFRQPSPGLDAKGKPLPGTTWKIENTHTGAAYELIPGDDDAIATDALSDWQYNQFPAGDLWVVRYVNDPDNGGPGELYDGYESLVGEDPSATAANLYQLIKDGQPVDNHDIVVWYGGHCTHNHDADCRAGIHAHWVGPTLRPVSGY
jgi:Cu2+-containing amine oxidase